MHDYTTPTKTKHEVTPPTKIRVVLWKKKDQKSTEMMVQKPRQDGIHNGSYLRHEAPTLQSIERVKDVRTWK